MQELCQELVTLRQELVTSATPCDKLEKEKGELDAEFEGVLWKTQECHRDDLEEQLGTFYSPKWEKVHQVYQKEVDWCRLCMQHHVNDLTSKHGEGTERQSN
ncbi:hypothetical protein AAFF_G00028670 [Aldrovandia affinis]|uniref:Uncharacterized protein n=1 Tax=Aldrovandia affinis TaxID=143900 RepID=A0AAD7WGJ8_9TELE|nr:hypothetical protein AAFF_G00028670 [Aldrovandia affinis]